MQNLCFLSLGKLVHEVIPGIHDKQPEALSKMCVCFSCAVLNTEIVFVDGMIFQNLPLYIVVTFLLCLSFFNSQSPSQHLIF